MEEREEEGMAEGMAARAGGMGERVAEVGDWGALKRTRAVQRSGLQ